MEAAELLRKGKLVAIPTETVYGLAANALDEQAVIEIFKAKKRPDFDPLIVHAADMESALKHASYIPPKAYLLAQTFWPGPLTLVLPKKAHIPYAVTSGLETVGLRVPLHAITLELLRQLPFPLAAPSANPFGYISPTTAVHVAQNMENSVDYILDGGACTHGIESTIIGFENDEPVIYRRGSLSVEEVESVIGKVSEKINVSGNPKTPGQLAVHYAPQKHLLLADFMTDENPEGSYTLINYGNKLDRFVNGATDVFNLSESENTAEAARKLYGLLRKADQTDSNYIITAYISSGNLAAAINDRLTRAASNTKTHE